MELIPIISFLAPLSFFVHFPSIILCFSHKAPFVKLHAFNLTLLHAAGVSRQQLIHNKMLKNVNILEFGDYIWNEKCIEISANIPGIGLETKRFCIDGATNGRVQSINMM